MPQDKYASLAELIEAGEKAYRVRALERGAPVTVLAPHGGYIEAGTSAIARAVAGREHNYFDFQGLDAGDPPRLHVTSTHFRHVAAERLLARCQIAVSIHGMGNQASAMIWLGGLNFCLKRITLKHLQSAGFTVDPNSPRYRGVSPRNIVNLAPRKGVQLELSIELLEQLFDGQPFHPKRQAAPTAKFTSLISALRHSIREYRRAH